ncbi:DUF6318 family protein [Nocardioides sp.]|uniref:DUF6318 family protein n=1 Tax=Nocardioides sp. TaxID=35761 RepID=UPI003D0DE5C9
MVATFNDADAFRAGQGLCVTVLASPAVDFHVRTALAAPFVVERDVRPSLFPQDVHSGLPHELAGSLPCRSRPLLGGVGLGGRHLVRGLVGLLSTIFCVVLLSGCDDDTVQSAPNTPAPTPSASVDRPPEKAAWERHTRAGAEAFARHWIDVFNHAMTTGDAVTLAKLGTHACESCRNLTRHIHGIYGSGGHVRSDGWRVLQAVATLDETDRVSVSLRVAQSPELVVRRHPNRRERFSGGKRTFAMSLAWQDRWQLDRMDIQ